MTDPIYEALMERLGRELDAADHGGRTWELLKDVQTELIDAHRRLSSPAPDDPRVALLSELASMPDEAFGWILIAIDRNIYPDGLGGFRPESRESIVRAKQLARACYPKDIAG